MITTGKNSNDAFKQYVRRVSFNISLSYNQIETLLLVNDGDIGAIVMKHGNVTSSMRKLKDIGLIQRKISKRKNYKDVLELVSWEVTEEGKLMAELLRRCGYEVFRLDERSRA